MNDQFFSDMEFPDQYYGMLVRSSIQRGKLVDIKAPSMPDGYFLYAATDIPGENRVSALGTTIPVFTPYEIQYSGEPLGIIVGPDPEKVHELVSEVLIETETLEPLAFGEKFSSSQIIGKRIIERGDPETILAASDRIFENTSDIGPQDHFYAEPLGVNVSMESGKLEIYTATQWPFHVRSSVSAVLDLDPDEIVVTPTILGESMDGKIWYPSLLAAQASLAAVLCKKPVKICFSRQEDFLFTGKSAPVNIRYRTAIAADGSIEAMTVRILINAGSSSPLIDEIIDRVAVAATGLYAIKTYRVEVFALKTNLPPLGALSGWGEAQAFFALETHLASIIQSIGASPVEWKAMNLLNKGRILTTGSELGEELRFPELFAELCAESDFPRKYAAYDYLNKKRSGYRDGPLRGIAIAMGYQGNGFLGKSYENTRYSVEMTIATDGQVRIATGIHSEPMRRILRSIASNALAIDESMIDFSGIDTSTMSETGPETLSSSITIIAPLLEKCCATIQKQRFRQPLPITVKKTYKPPKGDEWNGAELKGKPFISVTPGACIIELEMDPVTYETIIRGIWLACNPGKLYDKKAATTTIRKSIPVALSKMVAEHIAIRDGKLAPKDSIQYEVLSPSAVPTAEITFLESDETPRGLGSIAQNLVPAAYAAALAQITGSAVSSVPVDQKFIYGMLEKTEADA